MSGPLDGVRVVELAQWISAPATTNLLAEWGADIVKIEPLNGDPFRWIGIPGASGDMNVLFEFDNRGKRSVALDVKTETGRTIVLRLLESADVFITNMRPETLEEWKLDYASLREQYPALVYGSVTGYGSAGEQRDRPSYDIGGFWARSGLAYAHTMQSGEPPILRGAVGDHTTGMTLAAGVSAALFEKSRTGKGQHVECSLIRTGMYLLSQDLTMEMRSGFALPMGLGRTKAGNPVMNTYRSKDGRWFWLLGLQPDRHLPSVVRAAGHPEWLDDPRFATMQARRENASTLVALLDEAFGQHTLAELTAIFTREGVWWEPLSSPAEVINDPQLVACGAFTTGTTWEGDDVRMLAGPIDFSNGDHTMPCPAPRLGEHTDAVLADLGYSWDEIVEFKLAGAVL